MLYVKEGRANLGSFDVASGKQSDVTTGNQAVVSYRAVPDASKFVLLISTPTRVGDLYWLDKSGASQTAHTYQRRVVLETESHRAGRNLVHELRRQEDSDLGAEAT
jgi:hypothetical protein